MGSHVPTGFVRDRRRVVTWAALVAFVCAVMALGPAVASAGGGSSGQFTPGAPGAGDPYFPLDGNGGYDVSHYDLDVKYVPATDFLYGEASIRARATQNLSRFNLDLQGLTVHSIKVDGRSAAWSRDGSELTVTPRKGLRKRESFKVEVRYSGVPETLEDGSGFIHTDDGTLVVGQPHVAATWYPVNDHPLDKASYTFEITVPAGLEAVANGVLQDRRTKRGWTTWTWDAREPVASYLTTATIGEFDLAAYKRDGIRFWDAIDADLLGPPAFPRTGSQFAISQRGEPAYKRLQRTISVPGGGATVSFWVTRDTRAQLGLLLRRGAHGRDERLDDLARPERPHLAGHGFRLPLLALPAPVPRALPVGQRRRHLRPDRRHRRLARGQRLERGLRAVDGRPRRLRRQERRAVAHLRERRRLPAPGHVRRRHRRLHRRRLHFVRERREHHGRLDGSRARRPTASRRTRTIGSWARPPTRPSRSGPR